MKTTEASIQATLKQALETLGYIVGVVNAGRNAKASVFFQTAGLPDLFVTHEQWPQGEWLGLELKTATGRLRPAQKALNEKGRTVVVRSVSQGLGVVFLADPRPRGELAQIQHMMQQFSDKTAPRVEVTVGEVGK